MNMDGAAHTTARGRAKADRRAALLREAARLFAERGFNGVSIEELGAAAGVSGPAVYRHFPSKQALLGALLVGVSERLLVGGERVVNEHEGADALRELVRFHTDFALGEPDVIRVQDRDLDSLTEADRHEVRALQRRYVEVWVGVLSGVNPAADRRILRARAHAVFGLLNSTPHSGLDLSDEALRPELERMALAALGCEPLGPVIGSEVSRVLGRTSPKDRIATEPHLRSADEGAVPAQRQD